MVTFVLDLKSENIWRDSSELEQADVGVGVGIGVASSLVGVAVVDDVTVRSFERRFDL